MTRQQRAEVTDYDHLVADVQAAVAYVNEVVTGDDYNIEDRLFRAGLRLMRAEKGLEALGNVIDQLSKRHGVERDPEVGREVSAPFGLNVAAVSQLQAKKEDQERADYLANHGGRHDPTNI